MFPFVLVYGVPITNVSFTVYTFMIACVL